MKHYKATRPPLASDLFDSQVAQYASVTPVPGGIAYFVGHVDDTHWVDCLLRYDIDGALVGILNHFPMDFEKGAVGNGLPERAGTLTVMVRADRRRRGIATELVAEASKRWNPQPHSHTVFTSAGAALGNRYLAKHPELPF